MKILAAIAWLTTACSAAVLAQADHVAELVGTPYAEFGAIGILGGVVFVLLQFVLPAKDKQIAAMAKMFATTLKETNDRYNGWEHARHEDSVELHKVLRELTNNCAAARAKERKE